MRPGVAIAIPPAASTPGPGPVPSTLTADRTTVTADDTTHTADNG